MRRLVAIAFVTAAAMIISALPLTAQPYPPTPGADCAATSISTLTPWGVKQKNSVAVAGENHGSKEADCRFKLKVRGPRANVNPNRVVVTLGPGESATVTFRVKPKEPGTYSLLACVKSIKPKEQHKADDCVSASATAA